jgi:3,4-dihydroxy 2-butanone 4-phosphate synthase/GTP cyclohydrolase II
MAQPGGVLARAGHTEAGCDLARLAGLEPASVIVEILNEDGTMARRPQLEAFAREHQLKIGTIADLIRYRMENVKTVSRVSECDMPTEFGHFRLHVYEDDHSEALHYALVRGDIDPEQAILVRVHVQDGLCDMLAAQRDDCRLPLREALTRIAAEDSGVVVILGPSETKSEIVRRVENYAMQDKGVKLPRPRPGDDLRTYGVGAQILVDLGVRRMQVLGAKKRFHGLGGFGLEIVNYVGRE